MKRKIIILFSLKYKPSDWGILVNRADAKKELKKIDEALMDYDLALKLSGITYSYRKITNLRW